ncbi:MAG: HPF/RaiA family ribosome-associated protein [Spirochaetia bacterium]
MNVEMKAVHFDLSDDTREFVEEKLQKIDFAKDYIVDLLFTMTKEKHEFIAEVTVNFRWHKSAHIKVTDHSLHDGLERLIEKMQDKVRKEKEKIKEHKPS